MTLTQIFETLNNEYNSGQFSINGDKIDWVYNSNGVGTPDEAEDRWLSFLGAKITAQNVIEGTDYEIIEDFERNSKIGFSVRAKTPVPNGYGSTRYSYF
jgi:hypothetical protein